MSRSITIIGYGFISQLFARKYHEQFNKIITTTKSSNYTKYSTDAFFLDLYSDYSLKIPQTDYCIITIPFSRSLIKPEDYTKGIKKLINQLPFEKYKRVIFTSSTSIYATNKDFVLENSKIDTSDRAIALKNAEDIIRNANQNSFVLRLSGICGHTRNSIAKLKQPIINNSNIPVNLIHVDDIIDTMNHLINHSLPKKGDIINVTSSVHPTKKEYYTYLCQLFNLSIPKFMSSDVAYKKVSNDLLTETYQFKLSFPTPLEFKFKNDN